MDLYYIGFVARCFSRLMRKRYLISSEELTLNWRPLFETYERLLFSVSETLGLRFVPENLEANLSQAIRLARPHFPIEATQEMLDEWRPMLSPFSASIQRAVTYMNLFLPTTLAPEHHGKGFKLWFDEIMQLWLSGKVSVTAAFESRFTLLLSRLSSDCMGYIDWEPYIPKIFNYFKSSLNLNGGNSRHQIRRAVEPIDFGPCVQWMVYMISGNNSCLDYISKLFKAIESFYHPSNSDRRWHSKLQQFLYKLPACYVKRLYRERFKHNIWSRRIPESHKLTDEQTTKFVDAILPVLLTSMFNQAGLTSAALAFRDLSVLRPERVIPPLLDRLYGSYETLTEPHRLLATINCMASVVPAMVRPCKYFPEGPTHVVPLLLNSLPGIDSNDMRKCLAVFRFVATLAAHVHMKDYSYLVEERSDLNPGQQQLCLSTGQFEDFVIQFLDKCFILIENTANVNFSTLDQENQSKNGEEGIVEASISSVTLSILVQASPEIQDAAINKVYSHVTRHLFDTKTQGRAIATLCLGCAKASPEKTLAKFVPHFTRLILTLTENDEVFQESILDEELLFSLLLMSEIVRCNSPYILDHKESILSVLRRALKLSAKEGYMLGCSILRHLLRALTNICCCDYRNIDYNNPTNQAKEENWPFDNWAHTTFIKDLNIKWEIPGPASRQFATELLETFLKDSMHKLLDWTEDKRKLSRKEVQRYLQIVLSSLVGASSVLPTLKSPIINLCPLEVPTVPMFIKNTGTEPLDFPDGTNIRTWIVNSVRRVLEHILNTCEDDTKSLTLINDIFGSAISYFGYNKSELRFCAQRIKTMKNTTQNKLLGPKRHLRYLLVERVAQQHRAMLLNKGQPEFTELHLEVFKCLFELSMSHYADVRMLAQETTFLMLTYFPFSETILVQMLTHELRKKEIKHNRFKGLLYLVIGKRSCSSLAVDPNWANLRELWPALIESPHSEKASIVRLLDRICNVVQKSFDTFELRYKFPTELKKIASEVWTNGSIDLNRFQPPTQEYIEKVSLIVQERNQKRVEDYEQLVIKIVKLIEDPHLHWHRKILSYSLIAYLLRDDHPLPIEAFELCISSLISERLSIRLRAIQLVSAQLKFHKRKHKKRKIQFIKSTKEEDQAKANGYDILGNSNKWMQYKLSEGNYTKEEWDKLIFIDKLHIGFYDWPKELSVYEPYDEQPKLNRPVEDLNSYELAVHRFFHNEAFVEKLVGYFCFEDKGNTEVHRFDMKRPSLFKGLFRNFGPYMIEPFRKYIVEYAKDTCEQKQKFVIEFIGGLVRGSKHWSHQMMLELRTFVLDILDQLTITQENFSDWTGLANYVFRNRDVRRIEWLLNYFVCKAILPAKSTATAVTPFILASRLTLAHYSLIQCEWRAVDHIFPIVIENLKPQEHLLAYANVRACLASIYSLVYMFDDPTIMSNIPNTLTNCPKREEFIDYLLPKLAILEKSKISGSSQVVVAHSKPNQGLDTANDSDLALLAETMMKFRQLDTSSETPNLTSREVTLIKHKTSLDRVSSSVSVDRIATDNETLKLAIKDDPLARDDNDSNSFVVNLRSALPDIGSLTDASNDTMINTSDDDEERKDAIKLMKLTSCWIIYNVCRMKTPVPADFFKLLPFFCEMGRENSDPELAADALAAVAILGCSTLSPEAVVKSLKCVRDIIASRSWHARVAAAAFIEIMVSSNFFKLISTEEWRKEIEDIVINYLICDERIEVRESSSLTLSGMIHCEFTKLTPDLLAKFTKRASEPLVRRKQPNGTAVIDPKSTVVRHSGILCLCACVEAYPYTVPDYLPGILTLLSDHLTDPYPISTTIKKTMSNFRRTHHDNWQSDKTKFTDDQLCVLADLLVSPSYYA